MNQNQITQTDPLAILVQYEEAEADLEQVKRCTRPSLVHQGGQSYVTDWPRLATAEARLKALPLPPAREEAEAACLADIQALADEFTALQERHDAAFRAEMEAEIARAAAKIRINYVKLKPDALPFTSQQIHHQAHALGLALDRARYECQVISNRRREILDYIEREYNLRGFQNPEVWPRAAAERVEKVLGEKYHQGQIEEIKSKLGLSDKFLAFLSSKSSRA